MNIELDSIPETALALAREPQPELKPISLACIEPYIFERLLPFQVEGVKTAIQRQGRILIADDMGTGKSIQVSCWEMVVKTWLPTVKEDQVNAIYETKKSDLKDELITIVSYDIAVKLIDKLSKKRFLVMIIDESHSLKNATTKRCKTLLPFIMKNSERRILLSGTPALSRPQELFTQIKIINSKIFSSFPNYGKRYCNGFMTRFGWDFKGSSNMSELQLILERYIMIRRLKDVVMSQLPPKIRQQIFLHVKAKDLKDYEKLAKVDSTSTNTDLNEDDFTDDALQAISTNPMIMNLWKHTATIKTQAMTEYVLDLIDSGHKLLLFAHHREVLDAFQTKMEEASIRFIRIDGQTNSSSRQERCNQFQNDEETKVAILGITAAGVGLTLTKATTVVFAELFWNPGLLIQAEDRAHRLGQKDSVRVQYLLAKGTLDDKMWPKICKKLDVLESIGLTRNDFKNSHEIDKSGNNGRTIDKFFKPVKDSKNTKETEHSEKQLVIQGVPENQPPSSDCVVLDEDIQDFEEPVKKRFKPSDFYVKRSIIDEIDDETILNFEIE